MNDKNLIKKRFEKGIKTYQQNAIIQKRMADKLIMLIKQYINLDKFDNIFEIGCGSGILTKVAKRSFIYKNYFLNDITDVSGLYPSDNFILGDIEQVNLSKKEYIFDLIISNATFQWINDLNNLFKNLYMNLEKEGYFCFTTFGKENFIELKRVANIFLKYYSLENLSYILSSNNFEILHIEEDMNKLFFENPYQVLKHIKNTGVNSIKKAIWTKNKLNNFINTYQEFYTDISLTYHPIYIICKKRII